MPFWKTFFTVKETSIRESLWNGYRWGECSAGITTLMKKKNPFILSPHSITHRLALASGQAADSILYIKKISAICQHNLYHYSPKHWSKLKEMQTILECAEAKFKQIFRTRWLSFEGAVEAIIANLDPFIAALISDSPLLEAFLPL